MKNNNSLNLAIDKLFLKLCEEGDIENIKGLLQLYKPKKTNTNPFFSYFLNIANYFKTSIDPHCEEDTAFKVAFTNSNTEVLDFLVNIPNFVKVINKNKIIYTAFKKSLAEDNIIMAKYLHPLMEKDLDYIAVLYDGFIGSCHNGKLNSVKYLLTDSSVDTFGLTYWLNMVPGTHPTLLAGFIAACESSQPHILQYLSSSKYEIDFNHLNRKINVNDIQVMKHLIFDMNLSRNHHLIKNILFPDIMALNDLFDKRELFEDINQDLEVKRSQSLSKRPKI